MGLNLIAYKKPIGVVSFDVEKDWDEAYAVFGADERLLDLLREIGDSDNCFVTFNELQLNTLIDICQGIDDRSIQSEKDYTKRYSNETMLDFYKRWDGIIKGFKLIKTSVRWREEHCVVYVSY